MADGKTLTAPTKATNTPVAACAILRIMGVVANGVNAGTVQFQQKKLTSGTATVYANSTLTAWRVA